jgi:hypothetical protein
MINHSRYDGTTYVRFNTHLLYLVPDNAELK